MESRGLPLALRDLVDEPLSPGAQPRRRVILVLVQPGVDEPLIGSPLFAVTIEVGAILLACDKGLFLTVTPIRRKKRLIIDVSASTSRSASSRSQSACNVMSGFSVRATSRKSRCGISLEARWPPCPTGSRDPFRSTRSSHLIAAGFADLVAPRRCATAQLASLHCINHAVTQVPEYGFAISCGLRPANRLNQNLADLAIQLRISDPKQAAQNIRRNRRLISRNTTTAREIEMAERGDPTRWMEARAEVLKRHPTAELVRHPPDPAVPGHQFHLFRIEADGQPLVRRNHWRRTEWEAWLDAKLYLPHTASKKASHSTTSR